MHLDDYNCVVCSMGVEEDLLHVCFGCPFAILDSLARVSLRVSEGAMLSCNLLAAILSCNLLAIVSCL